ncbi:MAG TPA: NAD(P)H-binding protein [Pseudonocardiaceae bacterium]|jgi:uncharacterized protein YbjT (DUF2867 family)
MIVITGATGHVGGELVAYLAYRGEKVRAITRRPDAARFPDGVEAGYGDAADPASLDVAFTGADRAFLMSAQPVGSAPAPSHVTALAQAARRAGVEHAVLLSVLGGGTPGLISEWHGQAEASIVQSGMGWTLLRPGRFMSNALAWAPSVARGDEVSIPFLHRPAASIDPADIAAIAALALTEPDRHHGARYELSGPQALTPAQELAILADVLDRPLRPVEPPTDAVRAGMIRSGMPATLVDEIIAGFAADQTRGTEVLPTVSQVLGRPARTFAEWTTSHARQFQR